MSYTGQVKYDPDSFHGANQQIPVTNIAAKVRCAEGFFAWGSSGLAGQTNQGVSAADSWRHNSRPINPLAPVTRTLDLFSLIE